jgi:hypothetical protein
MNLRQPPEEQPEVPKDSNNEPNVFRAFRTSTCAHDFQETHHDSHKTYYKCKKCKMTTEV